MKTKPNCQGIYKTNDDLLLGQINYNFGTR